MDLSSIGIQETGAGLFVIAVFLFSITSLIFTLVMHRHNTKTLEQIDKEFDRLEKEKRKLNGKAKQLNIMQKAINRGKR